MLFASIQMSPQTSCREEIPQEVGVLEDAANALLRE